MAVGTSLRCSPHQASSLTRSVADQPPHVCLNFVHDFGDYYAHLRSLTLTLWPCSGYVKSFAIVARFVHAARTARAPKGTVISSTPVDAMHGLLAQTKQQGRLEEKFSGKPPRVA